VGKIIYIYNLLNINRYLMWINGGAVRQTSPSIRSITEVSSHCLTGGRWAAEPWFPVRPSDDVCDPLLDLLLPSTCQYHSWQMSLVKLLVDVADNMGI